MKYSDFSTNSKYKGWISGPVMNPELSIKNIPDQNFYNWSTPVYGENGNLLYSGETPAIDGNKLFDKNYSNTIPTGATNNTNNTASKLSGINFAAGIEPTAELIGSMLDRNYKNPMKYAELDNYANQGNVDSFDALENVYANLDKVPSASKMDFNGINGKGWFDNFLKDTTAGVSLGTSIAPGWGTLIGAVAGTANGLIRSGIQAGKSNKAYNDYLLAQEKANERLMANLNNSYHNAAMNEYNNLLSNMAAFGGKLNRFDMGGDISNGVNLIDSGSTHELNPYEGVQQGVDSQGIPNMVEEGEVVWEDEDYVFSNRLTVPKMPKKKSDDETKEEKFNRLYEGKTFAEVAERLQRESKERPTSSISKDTMNDNLSMLRDLQEEVKMKQQADEFRQEINSMSPEELMGLQQILGAMGQQGMEQPMPEQMPEQLPQEGMMPQGMPDMSMAVNPAMMGQPMMACGGKLKRFDYGGNLFALGGMSPDKWTLDTLQNTDLSDLSALPKKQTYGEALAFRGEFLKNAMDNMKGKYYAAIEQTHPSIYNKMIKGEPLSKDELETAKKVIHNCITSTSTANSFAEEELRNAIDKYKDALRLNFKAQGIDDKEIEESLAGLTTGLTTDSNDEVYTGIVARELQPSFSKDNYVIETDYDFPKGKVPEGSPLYKLLKELPDGVDLGVGYNGNSADPSSPAHYIKLYHDENGEPMLFEGNQSDYIKAQYAAAEEAMLNGKDFKWMNPMEYNEWIKTHNKGVDSKGNPIKYNSYEGSHVSEPGSIMNRPSYRKHDIGNKGENVVDMGHGRLRIMFPKMENISDSDFNNYIQTLQQNNIEVPLNKVQYEIPIDESTGKEGNARIRSIYPVAQDASVGKMSYPELESIYQETYTPNNLKPTINPISKPYIENDRPILNDMVDRWWLHDNSKIHYQNLPYYPSKEDENIKPIPLADGGSIHIKPENRGKFTALKERTGHSASWFKENGTPAQKKMATFALNAAKWNHSEGGELNKYPGGGTLGTVWDTLPNTQIIDWSKVPNLIGASFLPKAEFATLSSKAPKGDEPKERKEHPWWNDQWNNFKTAVTNEDWRLHAPEYATALGLAHEYLRDKSKDFAEEVNFARHITEPNISYRPTGTMAPYRPESSLAVLDRLTGMSSASRNAMINLSNASRAAKAMYNAMNDMRYFDALGQMDRQLREQNNTNYLKNLEFNNALAAQNAMGALQAASTNAQLKNSQLASWAHLMDTLNTEALQRDTAKGAMATNLSELVSQHRKEEIQNEMLREMAEKGSLLYYWDPRYQMSYSGSKPSALGGYIDVRPLNKRNRR